MEDLAVTSRSAWRRCQRRAAVAQARARWGGGALPADDKRDLHTRVQAKIHSLANSAAARATCRLAAAARRSQARRGAQPTQDAGDIYGVSTVSTAY